MTTTCLEVYDFSLRIDMFWWSTSTSFACIVNKIGHWILQPNRLNECVSSDLLTLELLLMWKSRGGSSRRNRSSSWWPEQTKLDVRRGLLRFAVRAEWCSIGLCGVEVEQTFVPIEHGQKWKQGLMCSVCASLNCDRCFERWNRPSYLRFHTGLGNGVCSSFRTLERGIRALSSLCDTRVRSCSCVFPRSAVRAACMMDVLIVQLRRRR